MITKYRLLVHGIKIESPVKFILESIQSIYMWVMFIKLGSMADLDHQSSVILFLGQSSQPPKIVSEKFTKETFISYIATIQTNILKISAVSLVKQGEQLSNIFT